jgi:hypothetical protein
MPKERSDYLFLLIKSLSKGEKRYFKLQIAKQAASAKIVRLFDLIDKQGIFDDEAILQKAPEIKAEQLSNLKAHLYERILHSLRLFHLSSSTDIQIREYIDYARILFDRSLYKQCLKVLKKAKKLAVKNDNLEQMLEILKWEKQVVAQGIDTDDQEKVNAIIGEVKDVNNRINNINLLSNIQVKLNNWYIKTGFIRKAHDYEEVREFVRTNLPEFREDDLTFNEKLNLFSVYVSYYLFVHDFHNAYHFVRKWVQLFDDSPEFIPIKTEMYIRGINKLMLTQSRLQKYQEFVASGNKLKAIYKIPGITLNENIRLMLFKYTTIYDINRHFLTGDFSGGISLITQIEHGLDQFVDKLGKHSAITFYYKFACMYIGDSNHRMSAYWLQKIINQQNVDLREDIHCFARILNLINHYEMGNADIVDYYIKSTYRFLLKKDDLGNYQKYIMNFLRNLNKGTTEGELIARFKKLRSQLLTLVDPYEKRAFIYFDIISWLESKIQKRTVQEVIQEKAMRVIERERVARLSA